MLLNDFDHVFELYGRRAPHVEHFGEAFTDGQTGKRVFSGQIIGGDDRVGVNGHKQVLIAL